MEQAVEKAPKGQWKAKERASVEKALKRATAPEGHIAPVVPVPRRAFDAVGETVILLTPPPHPY